MSLDYRMIGKQVRKFRKEREMTQEQLAERANRSPAFVGLIERGAHIMSVETLFELAQALNCSTDELLGLGIKNIDADNKALRLLEMAQSLAREKAERQ